MEVELLKRKKEERMESIVRGRRQGIGQELRGNRIRHCAQFTLTILGLGSYPIINQVYVLMNHKWRETAK